MPSPSLAEQLQAAISDPNEFARLVAKAIDDSLASQDQTKANFNAALVKLDADTGVNQTNFASTLTVV